MALPRWHWAYEKHGSDMEVLNMGLEQWKHVAINSFKSRYLSFNILYVRGFQPPWMRHPCWRNKTHMSVRKCLFLDADVLKSSTHAGKAAVFTAWSRDYMACGAVIRSWNKEWLRWSNQGEVKWGSYSVYFYLNPHLHNGWESSVSG